MNDTIGLPLDLPAQRRPVRIYNTKLRARIALIEERTGDLAPNVCDVCEQPIAAEIDREQGMRFDLFDVPDDVWAHYIAGRGMICLVGCR